MPISECQRKPLVCSKVGEVMKMMDVYGKLVGRIQSGKIVVGDPSSQRSHVDLLALNFNKPPNGNRWA
jgi:hypothetical protein